MCGVFFINDSSSIVNLKALSHRGPDETRLSKNFDAQYGFCRLAIREVSSAHQPLLESNYVSAINGELYNEEEIKSLILQIDPDAELPVGDMNLLGLYLHLTDGEGIINARGMFAGFVHQVKSNSLIYFRDAIGEKPLFCYKNGSVFALSSENRFDNLLNRRLSKLSYSPFELIRGHSEYVTPEVSECLPGHIYKVNLLDFSTSQKQFYTWPRRNVFRGKSNLDLLEKAIIESIERQSASDLPISILLSGGIDSSLVAFYAKQLGIKLSAFTLNMNRSDWNEGKVAAEFSEHLGMHHNQIKYTDIEIANMIPSILNAMDIPILDSACISMYLTSRAVSPTFKVSLSGDGGDELSRGYEIYRWLPFLKFLRMSTPIIPNTFRKLELSTNSKKYNSLGMKANRARDVILSSNFSISEVALSPFGGTPIFQDLASRYVRSHKFVSTEEYYEMYILPRIYLAKTDRMAMSNSLEVRSPFLDVNVIKQAMSFSQFSTMTHSRKWLLRALAEKHLPNPILLPRKRGFSLPFGDVVAHLEEPNWAAEIQELTTTPLHEIWVKARIDQNYGIAAWALMVLNHFVINKKMEFIWSEK